MAVKKPKTQQELHASNLLRMVRVRENLEKQADLVAHDHRAEERRDEDEHRRAPAHARVAEQVVEQREVTHEDRRGVEPQQPERQPQRVDQHEHQRKRDVGEYALRGSRRSRCKRV